MGCFSIYPCFLIGIIFKLTLILFEFTRKSLAVKFKRNVYQEIFVTLTHPVHGLRSEIKVSTILKVKEKLEN